jgi:hypothetical protein
MRQAAAQDVPGTAASAAAAGRAADAAAAAPAEALGSPSESPPASPFELSSWGAAVAEAAQAAFAALPPTGKPQPNEHTVMAAFLVSASNALQGTTSSEPACTGGAETSTRVPSWSAAIWQDAQTSPSDACSHLQLHAAVALDMLHPNLQAM